MSAYHLLVPNNLGSVPVAESFAHRVAAGRGLPAGRVARLTKAAGLAVEYAVLFAYPEGREDQITVSILPEEHGAVIVIHDNGVPALPGQCSDPNQLAFEARLAAALEGLEFQWKLLGYEGKELLIQVPSMESTPEIGAKSGTSEGAPVDAAQYAIRRLQPPDAAQVSRLVYRTYGHTYDDEDYYYPNRIVAENETGAMISVVAVHPSGEIVGHYALEEREPHGIYEGSSAVVSSEHRGKRLMERMREFATEEGHLLGLTGIMFLPWTIHTLSQKANEHFGAKLCAANLSDTSPVAMRGFEEESLAQRVSTLLYFTPLRPLEPAVIYAPHRHHEMIERIYSGLGRDVSFGSGGASDKSTQYTTTFLPHDRFAELRFLQIGSDFERLLSHELRELTIKQGSETVYLNLPLAQEACATACEAAEAQGFSFLGVGPCFAEDGDMLRMALMTQPLDPVHIHVLNPVGQELVAYCLAEAARVSL